MDGVWGWARSGLLVGGRSHGNGGRGSLPLGDRADSNPLLQGRGLFEKNYRVIALEGRCGRGEEVSGGRKKDWGKNTWKECEDSILSPVSRPHPPPQPTERCAMPTGQLLHNPATIIAISNPLTQGEGKAKPIWGGLLDWGQATTIVPRETPGVALGG